MTKKQESNEMTLTVKALSKNEAFARSAVAAFCVELNPTVEELSDIKTAVSEAVTNAVVHGYDNAQEGTITIFCRVSGDTLHIAVRDDGVGIADLTKALQPFYTTRPEEERSGMGFTVMESFMDSLHVESAPGRGVCVTMEKKIGATKSA
ncbi:MAG: anti-sigma F factor [Clostridiales bacterium]|jgi:stage II sporulation protein AB (anti-sigma F factor)|nr:anti-sigma F factor [Clostridiales bacterium]